MSIKIERVSVKNLGPLAEFDQSLKLVNLFYGHNETGKTYLVEFLYRSLFKHLKLSLRDNAASGKVIVSGLEKGVIDFSPSGKKKLEDFWGRVCPACPLISAGCWWSRVQTWIWRTRSRVLMTRS